MKLIDKKVTIIKDRVETYKDFNFNLLYYVYEYYLDSETLNTNRDIHNHFRWCFRKVNKEFLDEGLDFTTNKELEDYYYTYYYYEFYTADIDDMDKSYKYHNKFWKEVFDYNKQKNKNLTNILIELYEVFDESMNLKKNISHNQ